MFPLREYDVSLGDLVGWTPDQVRARLGAPDRVWPGASWVGPPPFYESHVRTPDGKIVQRHVFGVVPHKIPLGTPYEGWRYDNVSGSTWVLFFTTGPDARIVEVKGHPTGAKF